jgi:hypothetical protein
LYLLIYKNVNNKQGDFTMISLLKKLFGSKPAEIAQPEAAPYKVEVQPEPTPVAEKATEAVVASIVKPAKKTAPKKPQGSKPATKKAPRKPKASKPQA